MISPKRKAAGFTLIEVLAALLILSILAIMTYRGLGEVLDARDRVAGETKKWRRVVAFFARFEQDVQLASPRPTRAASGDVPAWIAVVGNPGTPARLEFNRFGVIEGTDRARRVGYRLNERHEIELWLWPGLDAVAGVAPATYVLLDGVSLLEFQYLNADGTWIDTWPTFRLDAPVPRAVRLRMVLESKEELVRVFALKL